jgi:hypothetical protein
MSNHFSTFSRRVGSAALVLGGLAVYPLAHADVIWYAENSGAFGALSIAGGTLTGGGSFTNVSQFTAANYRGAEGGYLAAVNGAGAMNYYTGIGGVYFGATPATTLTGGPLNGQSIGNNASYIGAADNLLYYSTPTGVSSYLAAGGTNWLNYGWSNLSGGGGLNGVAAVRGIGLKDFGGNTDISDGFLMYVQSSGTLGYYSMTTGVSTTFAGFGGWTTFTSGALAGLTLNALNSNPTGTVSGTSYRYLGEFDNGLFFDVTVAAVPEPSSAIMVLAGAAVLLRAARRRAA